MDAKNIKRIADMLQQDPELKSGEKIIVCLDRKWDSMLAGACLLTAGDSFHEIFCKTSSDDGRADEAVIRMSECGDDLVAFHETRPSSRDYRPNGIRVHHEELNFPCVVFYNSGEEPLTVDGEWLTPGEYTAIQEVDINSPEAQKALEEYLKSPEVLNGFEKMRRQMREKEGQV